MDFNQINVMIKSAPFEAHLCTTFILMAGLAYLMMRYGAYLHNSINNFGFTYTFKYFLTPTTPCFRKRLALFSSIVFVFFNFFGKAASPNYTMLDVFLPMYVSYFFLAVEVIKTLEIEMLGFKACRYERV